jgi:hypothetical protein
MKKVLFKLTYEQLFFINESWPTIINVDPKNEEENNSWKILVGLRTLFIDAIVPYSHAPYNFSICEFKIKSFVWYLEKYHSESIIAKSIINEINR